MACAREIVVRAHAIRKEKKIKVRQPLASFTYEAKIKLSREIEAVIAEEINVKKMTPGGSFILDDTLTEELRVEGRARDLIRDIQLLRKEKGCRIDEHIDLVFPGEYKSLPKHLVELVQKETLTKTITWGKQLSISTG